jgi:hypothetical protein
VSSKLQRQKRQIVRPRTGSNGGLTMALQATKTRHTMCRKLFGQLGRVFAPEFCTSGRLLLHFHDPGVGRSR